MIKTVLLELGDIFDSSWNRPIKEHSATELLLIIVKNLVRIRVSCAMKLPSYRQAQHWSENVTIKFFRVNVTGRRQLDWHCRARIVENWVRYYPLRSAVNKKYVYILAVISLSVWCMTWWLSLSKLPKLWCSAFKPVTWGSEKATHRKGKKGYVILKNNVLVEIPLRRKTWRENRILQRSVSFGFSSTTALLTSLSFKCPKLRRDFTEPWKQPEKRQILGLIGFGVFFSN